MFLLSRGLVDCVIAISILYSTTIYNKGQFSCLYTCVNGSHQSVVSFHVRAEAWGGGGVGVLQMLDEWVWLACNCRSYSNMNHGRDELAGLRDDAVDGAVTWMFHSNGLCWNSCICNKDTLPLRWNLHPSFHQYYICTVIIIICHILKRWWNFAPLLYRPTLLWSIKTCLFVGFSQNYFLWVVNVSQCNWSRQNMIHKSGLIFRLNVCEGMCILRPLHPRPTVWCSITGEAEEWQEERLMLVKSLAPFSYFISCAVWWITVTFIVIGKIIRNIDVIELRWIWNGL